jgi:hypothetical protein
MLIWHRRLWLIDHGAALYFQHAWKEGEMHAKSPFALIKAHVLLKYAGALAEVDTRMKSQLTHGRLAAIVDLIPDSWLPEDEGFSSRAAQREAYLDFFKARLQSSDIFVQEAIRARAANI